MKEVLARIVLFLFIIVLIPFSPIDKKTYENRVIERDDSIIFDPSPPPEEIWGSGGSK